ncbi:tetratricopeptide repeat protein [Dactylosporangium sp. AC04546]|uniref:SEL1-like repeat protein n=1 Tax=Dactylosporangium sp. AC04546 TaxID=2862460 RepID=UPI001EDFE7EF|nr:tetratricopeptide repeat protein [Dactylosporangium sp. AC04546]WVK88600.1 tetratricopeptide repeat protein [Dactylosporangium sp. AC04546]
MLLVILAGASQGFAAGRFTWPSWILAAITAVLAVTAGLAKRPVEVASAALGRPLERRQRQREIIESIPGYGVRVDESMARIEMDVHPSVELPDGADPGLSAYFPEYVSRDLDNNIRAWIRSRKATGGFVVLVGDAAAGKTRMLYEALREELPSWQMLCPDGGQLHALGQSEVDLAQAVLWLDDVETCIGAGMLTAMTLKRLISRPGQPVLIAATIRTGELAKAFEQPTSEDEPEINRHVREVLGKLGRWSRTGSRQGSTIRFDISSHFSAEEVTRAETVAAYDPRLHTAVRDSEDRRITATLAGSEDLLDHWTADGGDPAGQAMITAAVVARLCGRPEPVPASLIELLALVRLAARESAPTSEAWSSAAFDWAARPLRGDIRAIRAVRTTIERVDGYRVSDILIQRWEDGDASFVRQMRDDPPTWAAVLDEANASAALSIGRAAYRLDKPEVAERAWLRSAAKGNVDAMVDLGSLYETLDRPEAREWLEAAARRGDSRGMQRLGGLLAAIGEWDAGLTWLRRGAETGGPEMMAKLGFWLWNRSPADEAESEHWYRAAAELGDPLAMTNLGYIVGRRGELAESERWSRMAAERGHVGAMENLATLLRARGEEEEAFDWFRRAAEAGYDNALSVPSSVRRWSSEAGDEGISNAVLGYADLLLSRGASEAAEKWYTNLADLGDARAAERLAKLAARRGDYERAWQEQTRAARLAHDNLRMHWSAILAAYGPDGGAVHVRIITQYAEDLLRRGETEAAALWRERAVGPWASR